MQADLDWLAAPHEQFDCTTVRVLRLYVSISCSSRRLTLVRLTGANGLASLVLQCLWESFALPVIVNPLVSAMSPSRLGSTIQTASSKSCQHAHAVNSDYCQHHLPSTCLLCLAIHCRSCKMGAALLSCLHAERQFYMFYPSALPILKMRPCQQHEALLFKSFSNPVTQFDCQCISQCMQSKHAQMPLQELEP